MMSLENADSNGKVQVYPLARSERTDSLVVCIPDPRKRAQDRDCHREARDYTHYQYCVVVIAVINKDQDHFEY